MKRIWYHANCLDGFTAAWVFHKRYGPKIDIVYQAVKYGDALPEFRRGDEVYILDFSWDRQTLIGLRDALGSKGNLLVLDHHKTAQKELEHLNFAYFDMERSGAGIAWDYFHRASYSWDGARRKDRPLLVDIVEDRDLWNFQRPDTKTVTAYMMSVPMNFGQWDEVQRGLEAGGFSIHIAGEAILRTQEKQVKALAESASVVEISGLKAMLVNTSILQSEVCHYLLENHEDIDLAATAAFNTQRGNIQWSLRSRKDGVDVSEIAKTFGGGGHHSAAGFYSNKLHEVVNASPKIPKHPTPIGV
jgi:nanoRNase/pAp phosphatase (c-di-AMP/oligoRNAs hydrolase)